MGKKINTGDKLYDAYRNNIELTPEEERSLLCEKSDKLISSMEDSLNLITYIENTIHLDGSIYQKLDDAKQISHLRNTSEIIKGYLSHYVFFKNMIDNIKN